MSLSSPSAKSLEQTVRAACAELGRRLRAGESCAAEEYLERYPAIAQHSEAALELIYTEYVVRTELQQEVSSDDWFVRFPQWKSDLQQLLQVHQQIVDDEVQQRSSSSRGAGARRERAAGEPATLEEGKVLGNYQLLGELGRGGMGVVFRARQLNLNRDVALKMILSGEYASPRELARFQTEAESAARLQHPHIVQVYEIGAIDGRVFLSMELLEGGGLDAQLKVARLDPRGAAALLEKLARTVQFAHERGVVHRDLKPSNVLLTPEGEPKIADFGLAKELAEQGGNQTKSGAALGTPSYMAPEQAAGDMASVGPAADIYALGVILYETLCGRPPLVGDTPLDTMRRVFHDEPTPPSRIRAAVPRELETICLKCLAKTPRERYASAAALAEDLQRFLANEPILAKPASVFVRLRKWARRRPALAGLIVTLVIAFVAVVVFGWMAERRRQEAVAAAERASRSEQEAQSDRTLAIAAQADAEWALYFRRVGQAHAEYMDNRIDRAQRLLAECPPEVRDWEWDYLNTRVNSEIRVMPVTKDTVWSLAFSPDGRVIAGGTGEWGATAPGHVTTWPIGHGLPRVVGPDEHGPIMAVDYSRDGRHLLVAGQNFGGDRPGGVKVYLAEHSGPRVLSLPAPGDNACCAAFHPDGATFATAGMDGVVRVWNTSDGAFQFSLRGHQGPVTALAYHPNGQQLATGGRDGSLRVWNLTTRQAAHRPLEGFGDVRRVAYTPDGRALMFSTHAEELWRWELSQAPTAIRRYAFDTDVITSFSICPSGRRVAVAGHNGGVFIADATTGVKLKRMPTHEGTVRCLAFSPDGRNLVTGGMDRMLKLWDVRNDASDDVLPLPVTQRVGEFSRVCITPDGAKALLPMRMSRVRYGAGEPVLLEWDFAARRISRELRGHSDWLNDVDVSRDGTQYVTASDDGTACLWDAATGEELRRLEPHPGPVAKARFSPDGRWVVTVTQAGSIFVWERATGKLTRTLETGLEQVFAIGFHPTRNDLAVGGNRPPVKIWDIDSGEVVRQLDSRHGGTLSLAFSPDGEHLATGDEEMSVRIWNIRNEEEMQLLQGHSGRIMDIVFSGNGKRIITAATDYNVKLWDVRSNNEVLTLRGPGVMQGVAFHPDGCRLLAVSDGTVKEWTTRPTAPPDLDEVFLRTSLAWHDRERVKAEWERDEFAVQFHDERAGRIRAELESHGGVGGAPPASAASVPTERPDAARQ